MARVNNDMRPVSSLLVPGVDLIFESMLALVIPLIFIATLAPHLLLEPALWTMLFAVTLRRYTRRLGPVTGQLRGEFGALNATLNETVSGIEVVKSTARSCKRRASSGRAPGATATCSSSRARSRGSTCPSCCWPSPSSAPSCTASGSSRAGRSRSATWWRAWG